MSATTGRVVLSLLLLLMAACSRPAETVAPQLYTLDSPRETVFSQAIALLAEWNMPLSHTDEQAGVITTDQFVLGGDDKFLGEGAGHWADCGTELFISRAATADEFRIRCTLSLRETEDGKTQLRVQTNMTVYEEDAIGTKTRTCASRRRLEARFAEELQTRLAGGT